MAAALARMHIPSALAEGVFPPGSIPHEPEA